jgi:hypothetical protein
VNMRVGTGRMPPGHLLHSTLSAGHGRVRLFETDQVVAARIEEAFAFFSNAANLDAIRPCSLELTILTPLPILG